MAYDPRRTNSGASTPQPPPPPPPPPETSTQADMAAAAHTLETTNPASATTDSYKLKFCTVCASNNNRSMEAHLQLSGAPTAFPVISFGTGSLVRLPGPSITQPNVYSFNSISYNQMYKELSGKDERLYRGNGILNMLDRNRQLKWGPERFQDWVPGVPRVDHLSKGDKGAIGTEGGIVDIIITCEERCWDAVVDDLMNKGTALNYPVHVFNVDIKDNHEEALTGGKAILDLANRLNEAAVAEHRVHGSEGWENGTGPARQSFDEKVPEILADWQERYPSLPALWTLAWL
ncbi:RNA polymerase II subunit A C-terminal domain phosphatase [Penicillium thymicola]|uniref:RNA polymerase II subunit A C-terminal domain phosphatase SSU72 n=1 Tax=Penicillium thymicola TaxID=293382 RepID=A0AAI9XBA1_PENTH|nr:RNA polymerase II subunit A C-terminal domain phosphatase [Penicillium thymicola]